MLKKLRIKFIIVIMSMLTVLFAVIFGGILHFTRRNLERESLQMMRAMAFQPMNMTAPIEIPDDRDKKMRLPFFTLRIENNGTITASGGGYYDLTDKELLQKLTEAVSEKKEPSGIIAEYDLRYLVTRQPGSRTIVFADISSERTMLNGLIRNCIIAGLIGYAVFFIISLLLAKWVTKPVEKTWTEQKQFIADASHELKTPLTVIMTNAEMLNDNDYTEADRSVFTKNILSMSKRMRGLVESLLELARMDNRTSVAEMKSLDLSKLVSDSMLPFEPLFFERNMELSSDIEPGITAEGDKNKLRQVMSILLDNALKYDDPSDPVNIRLVRKGLNAVLSVSGKGKPLSKAECKNIFKRFYRVDQARTDGSSYGLGLSIAESIINEHGGRIWAESEEGFNTFFVSVNLKK
ncbi:MAG: HAMP domain-containing histidine kinase [Oscillospiraceae bacterium]|nr:HAMP domain-containing histidine kinase [Oscillospiraceae bacterium]MCR4760093.1 HAMP domain-containing histidine kinase [Oscillospiraceae bacterium]